MYLWKSVSKYCQCPDSVNRIHCKRGSSCRNVTEKAFSMQVWKNKKFCLNPINTGDWTFAKSEGEFGCPDGFRRCAGGVCVKKTLSACPITDLIVASSPPAENLGKYENISYFMNDKSFFVSRTKERSPLIRLEAEIASAPCINAKLSPKRTNGKVYPIIVNFSIYFLLLSKNSYLFHLFYKG